MSCEDMDLMAACAVLVMALEEHLGHSVDTDAMVAIEDISGIVDILNAG